ncbi:MAG TPA: TIGR04255 family protein [Planctomycetaceae bacterium]|nr:TIGR04255 family protein [Planctomycetaceae bacterium]
MSPRTHYSNAPITEAILDIRTTSPEGLALERLEEIHSLIQEDYPSKQQRNLARGRWNFGTQVGATATQTPLGYLFLSPDEKQIVQVRMDGFTMSRLAPYESWEQIRDEAHRLWEIYSESIQPRSIERVAVRYINRIDIPLPFGDLTEYLRTIPQVSPDLPQELSGLFMQLTLPQPDIDSEARLSEALIDPVREGVVSIVLDIDLYRIKKLPYHGDAIWEFFEILHDRKNRIFEACITDRTRELIS